MHEIAHLPAQRRTALITGITGQDGSYLAELLLSKGYKVHGIVRRSASFNTGRIDHLYGNPDLHLHYGDMTDGTNLTSIIATSQPSEIYNLAAQSHVQVSFDMPEFTGQCDAIGALKLLDAIRSCGLTTQTRFYQASTSELYGKVQEIPQKETTPFYPRSPYAVAKLYAYWMTVNYREAYNMFACNGILFNHESPRRGATFVTRKIARGVARIERARRLRSKQSAPAAAAAGAEEASKTGACGGAVGGGVGDDVLFLGNLDAKRDWGHAKDFVLGMWMILQADTADDWVLATGEQHSVREFCELCFKHVGTDLKWRGEGLDEVGYDAADDSRVLVRVDPLYFRPTEVETLLGDPSKVEKKLGWKPTTSFQELVTEMMDCELKAATSGEQSY